jgi:hypothetical protein
MDNLLERSNLVVNRSDLLLKRFNLSERSDNLLLLLKRFNLSERSDNLLLLLKRFNLSLWFHPLKRINLVKRHNPSKHSNNPRKQST